MPVGEQKKSCEVLTLLLTGERDISDEDILFKIKHFFLHRVEWNS